MFRDLDLVGVHHIAGGTIGASFAHHMKRAVSDCEDRPGEKKARKIILVVNVTPQMLQDGAATDVKIDCEVSSTVPKHISKTGECMVKHGGRAVFNDLSEKHVDQGSLPFGGEPPTNALPAPAEGNTLPGPVADATDESPKTQEGDTTST
jgi:hypothetical protein